MRRFHAEERLCIGTHQEVELSDDDERDEPQRPPPPWGDEITPLTEVCGGQYVLLHELARGDLSIVYRAKPTGQRDAIAFKVMQSRYLGNETQVHRFRREAEVLKRIEHPNVVRLIDHGTIEDGRAFVALELLVGRTLAEALAEAERMSPERTCRIARQIARALRAMHRAGVIHRDLKPENILVIGPEDGERVKLVDFTEAGDVGAPARRVRNGRSEDSPSDEPSYRPPEQVRMRPPQPPMDVFALGVIMFEMLAGEHPFAVAKTKAGPTIRSKAFDAPEVLLMLVADCIEKDVRERPRSMDEVLDRLDKALLWMGVVPQDLGIAVDEDERTQPYSVADPGSPEEEKRAREVAEAAKRAEEAKQAEEAKRAAEAKRAEELKRAAEAKATTITPPDSESQRRSATVAGEVHAASGSFPADEELLRRQRRRRPGSDRPKDPATWDARGPVDTVDDAPKDSRRDRRRVRDDGRRARASDSRRGRTSDSRTDGARRRRSTYDSRDESWDEEWPSNQSTSDSRDESWDDAPASSTSDSWDEGRRRGSRDGPTTDSTPHIDPNDLREKEAPTGPRFVVDTVAWTKQQPSAKPDKERRRTISDEEAKESRRRAPTGDDRKGSGSRRREQESRRRAPTGDDRKGSGSRRREPERKRPSDGAARRSSSPRAPTSAQAPLDPSQMLPRWVLPLLVMVILALAYAVWLVWTR